MRRVFYSFHYARDAMRVQSICQMGIFDGDRPALPNHWEEVRLRGDNAIKRWIDEEMDGRTCVCVLIGEQTHERRWVGYEIERGWNLGKGVLGVAIHDLHPVNERLARHGVQGENPFKNFQLELVDLAALFRDPPLKLSDVVPLKMPDRNDAYHDIENNLSDWIEEAIKIRKSYGRARCTKIG